MIAIKVDCAKCSMLQHNENLSYILGVTFLRKISGLAEFVRIDVLYVFAVSFLFL
jgi:hypothetical protein